MNVENNNEKIKKLETEIANLNPKNSYFDEHEYLKKMCEIRIRNIMTRYYNGKELTEKDIEIISKYKFFSNPTIYQGSSEGQDFLTLRLISSFGSGNFESNELEFINLMFDESKTIGRKTK